MDLSLSQKPGHAFRIEMCTRVSLASRRVNLQLLTQRTTDYHSHLMEFDIPDTDNWHTISMTTHGFDARPGDTIIGHLALMDWGLEKYGVDLDYMRVPHVLFKFTTADENGGLGDECGSRCPQRRPWALTHSRRPEVGSHIQSRIFIEVDIVNVATAGPDKGAAVPYHPPITDV